MKNSQPIPKLTKPRAEGDARRKGKKNLNWKEDPDILTRLARVSDLMVRHKTALSIAQETKVSLGTAKRDIIRVRELWKADALDRVSNSGDLAIAQYGALLQQAWQDATSVPATHPNRAAFFNVALRAQERIDKVTGIGSDKVEHSGPNGGAIPVEVSDVEQIRKKRWQQIAGSLAELESQEKNATIAATSQKP